MATLKFGTDPNVTWGVAQSVKKADSAEVAEARGPSGKVIAQKAYSVTREVTLEVLIDTESGLPEVGETASYDGKSWLVTAVNESSTNTEFSTGDVTLQRKDEAELEAVSGPAETD